MARKRFLTLIGSLILCAVLINLIGCDLSLSGEAPTETEASSGSGGAERITAAPLLSATEKESEDASEKGTEETDGNASEKGTEETGEDMSEKGTEEMGGDKSGNDEDPTEIADGNVKMTDFALDLFKEASKDGENTLISPLSVLIALSMTANGAEGGTREQMESVLGMSTEELNLYIRDHTAGLPQGEKYKLSIANSVWFKDEEGLSIKEDFLRTNEEYYGADIFKAPFNDETLKDINAWVNDKTDGMIPDVLDEIPAEAIMYLINALAFDAEWADQYSEGDVYDGKFTREDGADVDVKMMRGEDGLYIEDERATGFIKFYDGRKYAFVALLPNEDISVSDYLSMLDGEALQAVLNDPLRGAEVHTSMPKFAVEYDVEMSSVLKNMGMVDAFDWSSADFSRLGQSARGNIFINRVIHKTFIEVGELGTRAGASTVVEMFPESAPMLVKQVDLDRPFVYMIIDWENKVPFFIGTMMDPGK